MPPVIIAMQLANPHLQGLGAPSLLAGFVQSCIPGMVAFDIVPMSEIDIAGANADAG